jgi:glucose-1-phosphate adenylyltransferase
MAAMKDTLAMIMAGGKGSRLGPLTLHRSKPAVPFAGQFRIIDFVLSNFINSGYRRIYLLTQYMASSLIKHLSRNWRLSGFGEYIEVVPAQMRLGEFWYRGTADAVYQNLNLVRDARPAHVCVFGGDHVYKFAVDQMDEFHRAHHADLTVAGLRGAAGRGPPVRLHRHRRSQPHHRVRREAGQPAGDPRPPRLVAGVDGQLRLPGRGPDPGA